jgi:hypothetical protein
MNTLAHEFSAGPLDRCLVLSHRAGLPTHGPARLLACHGGGGGKSNTSSETAQTATTEQIGASDQAIVLRGDHSTITTADPEVAKLGLALANEVTGKMSDLSSGVLDTALSSNAQLTKVAMDANDRLTALGFEKMENLAMAKVNDGQANTEKTMLIMGAILAAGIVGTVYFTKSK